MVTRIRTLSVQDIAQAKKLSDAEGWNQTAEDWKLLLTAPGNIGLAFSVGNKTVATATAMTYGKELAWIGMVLVDSKFRGKGISRTLMTALLDRLKSFKSIKLDATQAGQPVYEKFGFSKEGTIHRMTSEAIDPDRIPSFGKISAERVGAASLSEIIKYDKQAMGFNRDVLMEYLFREYPRNSFVLRKDKKMKGYVLGRKGPRFCQAGPMAAETEEDARNLMISALNANGGESMVVDVPENKKEFMQWLKKAGFTVQRSFTRMYLRNGPFDNVPEKYFLIAGPEFG